jgi:hypothetical protein
MRFMAVLFAARLRPAADEPGGAGGGAGEPAGGRDRPGAAVTGLTKGGAEALLDCLEARGCLSVRLSFQEGAGFAVDWVWGRQATRPPTGRPRPAPLPASSPPDPAG